MAKPLGWRREPARHALAAVGVKTGRKGYPKRQSSRRPDKAPYLATIEWIGDSMPSMTTRHVLTHATSKETALLKVKGILKRAAPEWTIADDVDDVDKAAAEARRLGKDPDAIVLINVVNELPYDYDKFTPEDVVSVIMNENDIGEDEAWLVHNWLLSNDPDQLEPLLPIAGEGETIPVPDPDVVSEALEQIRRGK